MIDPYKIAREFIAEEHELGKEISENEAITLADSLRARLGESTSLLDLTPGSLNFLSKSLLSYYEKNGFREKEMAKEDLVLFIREIASYIGLVLVFHADGKWDSGQALDSLMISFARVKKATKTKPENIIKLSVGIYFPAYKTITALEMGINPNLFFIYENSKGAKLKEILG